MALTGALAASGPDGHVATMMIEAYRPDLRFALALSALTLLPAAGAAQVQGTSFESEGVELKAYFHHASDEAPRAVAIYLQGNPGGPLPASSVVADELTSANVAVLRFNYRGLWGNGGDFMLTNAIGDLNAAVDFLSAPETMERFGLPPSPILVIGYSFGTAVGLIGARDDDRIAGVVSLAPCDHGYFGAEIPNPDSKIRDFLDETRESLFGENGVIDQDGAIFMDDLAENAARYSFTRDAEALLGKKLLFIVGLDDQVCYAEDHFFPLYRELKALSHPALDVRVLETDHGFSGVGMDAVMRMAVEWVRGVFGTGAPGAPAQKAR
ncbi:MAG: alpha/beta fold hydrolase [Gemmatimonadales bacterium]|nr:MAG: alpha/beta fold hydrolase [Gemmatimonadales bacterium]